MLFPELMQKTPDLDIDTLPERMICLDPGETTGYAFFEKGELVDTRQLNTKDIGSATHLLKELFDDKQPTLVVYEDYKLYAWKAQAQSWSKLHTPQFIGTIKTLCALDGIDTVAQMAQQAKYFCTDKKLKEWGYYDRGMKHARDAVRHGCYYMLFNHKNQAQQKL